MVDPSLIFKVIVAGDAAVGKTTMLNVYVNNKFSFDTRMTLGADMFHKVLILEDGNVVSLQIWDFGGQERFRFFLDTFSRGASAAFLMYDLTDINTFNNLPQWEQLARKFDSTLPIVLVGGKYDLEDSIEVDDDLAFEFVEKYNCRGYYKTSAKSNYNVDEIFETITMIIIENKGIDLADQSVEI